MAQFIGSPLQTILALELNRTLYKLKDNYTPQSETKFVVIGALQSIGFRVNRYKAPVYVIGSTAPVNILKGPRTIAGSMSGVILSQSLLLTIAEYFLIQAFDASTKKYIGDLNGVPIVNAIDDLQTVYGGTDAFWNNFLKPIIQSFGVTPTEKDDKDTKTKSDKTKTLTTISVDSVLSQYMKLPPLSLDDIPPIKLHIIVPIKQYVSDSKQRLKYEQITLNGFQFTNSGIYIEAGREAVMESCNFILQSVTRKIEDKELVTNQ